MFTYLYEYIKAHRKGKIKKVAELGLMVLKMHKEVKRKLRECKGFWVLPILVLKFGKEFQRPPLQDTPCYI